MRVTNSMTNRNFLKSYNSSLGRLNKLQNQAMSWRSFDKVSEDPAAAAKAFIVRRNLARNNMYQENLEGAKDLLSSAETSATNVNSAIKMAQKQLLYGLNGTTSLEGRETIAQQMEFYRDEIIKNMNNSFSGRYIFGGTSNEAPFKIDETSGMLTFNGIEVTSANSLADFPMNDDVFIDIGIGLKIDDAGNVDPQSALQISTSGIDFLGFGKDADGLSNNICDALTDIARMLREDPVDQELGTKYKGKLNDMQTANLTRISDIGNRINFIDSNIDRLKSDTVNLTETQNDLETVNPAETITLLKMEEVAYKTCLQMGPRIIQPSLFEYIR